ncbi:MAG: crossover junction endodeoxyribonuclease RuvC [Angelakisella sp.]
MRVLGIDPGYAIVGWGVLDYSGSRFTVVDYGAVTTPAGMEFNLRLAHIYTELTAIIEHTKPDVMSIEQLFFTNNQKTGIDVAQARGVILLSAVMAGVETAEYTPLQVKQSVVGYGRAEKAQVMDMTKRLLNLKAVPKPDDTADALALAICHAHTGSSLLTKKLLKGG